MTADAAGVCCAAISVEFDQDLGDELDLVSATEAFFPLSPLTFGIEGSQESQAGQSGLLLTFEGFSATAGPVATTFTLATVVFQVTANVATDGADVFTGALNAGFDAVANNASADVTASVVFGDAAVDARGTPALVPGLGAWATLFSVLTMACLGTALVRTHALKGS